MLTRERMLDRMLASDRAFDGKFITGVHSTGIYCLPSCRGKKPKPENVVFYSTVEEARAAGLRPCKRCRPDEFYAGRDPDLEALESLVQKVVTCPERFRGVQDMADALGFSQSVLYELMRRHYHSTPAAFLAKARVAAAYDLLVSTRDDVAEIALSVGFEGLSAFYENFKRLSGLTPTDYRALASRDSFVISLPDPFPVDRLFGFLGRDPHSVSERVSGRKASLAVRLDECPAVLELENEGELCRCSITNGCAVSAHRVVAGLLGLGQDYTGFEASAKRNGQGNLIAGKEGLRIPQTPSIYDAYIWAILGQQVNLAFAYRLRNSLLSTFGAHVGQGLFAPPTPEQIGSLEVADLQRLQLSRSKAAYLIEGSRQLRAVFEMGPRTKLAASATRVERAMLSVKGVGAWTANYILMRAMEFSDCVPVGDTGLTSGLQKLFSLEARPGQAKTYELLEPFSPYRSLATFHVWQTLGGAA